MPAMAEVELTRGPDDPHHVPTVLTAMHLGDDDLCSICWKDDASAYWDGGPETFRVCRRCAVEKLPLLIADAIAGPFHLESAGYPAGKLAVQRFEQAIPAILGAFWRGVAFLDEMGGRFRKRLVRVAESKGNLDLEWTISPPKGYRKGCRVSVADDQWTITRSVQVAP
jgi:hypothetical protein